VEIAPESAADGARVFAFLHGQQMALTSVRGIRETAVLVSHSRDGELQASVMRALSLRVVRGSSSRGGARSLRALARLVRAGMSVALAVDGPRGPAGKPKPGAAALARLGGASLVPVASAAARKIVLRRTWDAFEIPLPFSRVVVVIGAPLVGRDARSATALERALVELRRRATALALGPHRETSAEGSPEETSCSAVSP
jgi:lysophospholipid acyltransferase (LPLAT)-like uncharacterized protein